MNAFIRRPLIAAGSGVGRNVVMRMGSRRYFGGEIVGDMFRAGTYLALAGAGVALTVGVVLGGSAQKKSDKIKAQEHAQAERLYHDEEQRRQEIREWNAELERLREEVKQLKQNNDTVMQAGKP